MPKIARIIVDIALNREFEYLIPDNFVVTIGSRVRVPFGRSKRIGYVVGIDDSSDRDDLKEILLLMDKKSLITDNVLKLARWIGDYYCAPIEQVIRTVLPGAVRKSGAGFKQNMFVSLSDIKNTIHVSDTRSVIKTYPSSKLPTKQKIVLKILQGKGGMFLSNLIKEAGVTVAPVRSLEKKGLVSINLAEARRNPLANHNILPTNPLKLMPEQDTALTVIKESIDKKNMKNKKGRGGVILLHGVTGSGKTEVYLQAIDYVLKKGMGAIVLVPEISLTPQTVERFLSRFGNRIAVLHSHLSDGERHDEWHRIRDGRADIVIGARSAVFAPVKNPGLIVVDEEHEPSYKQEEAPRYNARDIAVMRGMIEKCTVVLGSATPSLESWHNAIKGKYELSTLPRRADNCKMPVMRVIDMRVEAEQLGKISVFSRALLNAIHLRLDKTEQVILFLNRRGFSTSIICPKCGYVANCNQCSVSYTYHRKDEMLRCHICGGKSRVPSKCPGCNDPSFKFTGIGTQRIETIIKKIFPNVRVQRIDTDVTVRKNSYDKILGDFRAGKTDILIGTQMIAKGLHFPNVTLVGVVYADLSLHIPDFRAGERTFQLLAQVAGRAGRGEVSGEVIVQTYTPFHTAIQAVRRIDYEGFCDQELEYRRELSYPPFSHLICITLRGSSEDKVSFFSKVLFRKLKKTLSRRVIITEPMPAPLARAKGLYRYQIMLRHSSPSVMTISIKKVMNNFELPRGMTCLIDVDAISIL